MSGKKEEEEMLKFCKDESNSSKRKLEEIEESNSISTKKSCSEDITKTTELEARLSIAAEVEETSQVLSGCNVFELTYDSKKTSSLDVSSIVIKKIISDTEPAKENADKDSNVSLSENLSQDNDNMNNFQSIGDKNEREELKTSESSEKNKTKLIDPIVQTDTKSDDTNSLANTPELVSSLMKVSIPLASNIVAAELVESSTKLSSITYPSIIDDKAKPKVEAHSSSVLNTLCIFSNQSKIGDKGESTKAELFVDSESVSSVTVSNIAERTYVSENITPGSVEDNLDKMFADVSEETFSISTNIEPKPEKHASELTDISTITNEKREESPYLPYVSVIELGNIKTVKKIAASVKTENTWQIIPDLNKLGDTEDKSSTLSFCKEKITADDKEHVVTLQQEIDKPLSLTTSNSNCLVNRLLSPLALPAICERVTESVEKMPEGQCDKKTDEKPMAQYCVHQDSSDQVSNPPLSTEVSGKTIKTITIHKSDVDKSNKRTISDLVKIQTTNKVISSAIYGNMPSVCSKIVREEEHKILDKEVMQLSEVTKKTPDICSSNEPIPDKQDDIIKDKLSSIEEKLLKFGEKSVDGKEDGMMKEKEATVVEAMNVDKLENLAVDKSSIPTEMSDCLVTSRLTPTELGENIDSLSCTLFDSSENSPAFSTPAESCQASAAPSPKHFEIISKDTVIQEETSMDTKDTDDCSKTPVPRKRAPICKKKKKSKPKSVSRPIVMDEETQMDANTSVISDVPVDEDSLSSTGTTAKKEVRRFRCEVIVPESTEAFTVEKVVEYIWPLEGLGEHYFIQEHMSQFLGIMSFKRKYPDLRRRPIESQEKEYLKDKGIVNEMACDLGLTAVRSEDVLDVMFNDFPCKYEELNKALRDRKEKQLKEDGRMDYQVVNLDKSKMHEYSKKAAKDAAIWNIAFNRERKDERRYAFDLQTFTLHCQQGLYKKLPAEATKIGSYPLALLPGQYTDFYRQFSPAELRAVPLQTVLTGPFTADELNAEMQHTGESEDESVSASQSTGADEKDAVDNAEPPPPLPAPVTVDPLSAEKLPRCKVCNGSKDRNKVGKPEPLIICGSCRIPSHPTCIDLTLSMVQKIESYSWQCMECKTCAQCNDPDDEERMIFCDMCDRGYHIYCVGLRRVPNGRWHCKVCACCFSCGSRAPSGYEPIKNAEWQHEFRKEKDKKELKYACTLCVPCDKYWKRRQFCHVCMKVYRSIPEDGMIRCAGCPKYVHRDGGCSTQQDTERYCANCMKSRRKTALNHSRILAAAKKKMACGY